MHRLAEVPAETGATAPERHVPFFYRRGDVPPDPRRPPGADGTRRRRYGKAGVAVGVVLVLAGGVAIAVVGARHDGVVAAFRRPAAATAAAVPLNGRRQARLDMVTGTSTVTVRAAGLGGDLYRVTSPAGSAVTPHVEQHDGTVRISLRRSGQSGRGAVTVLLNAAVRWDLRLAGGAERSVVDMSAGRLRALDLAGGATRIELNLPRAEGTLGVRMSGGVNQFLVRTVGGDPVRVRVGKGAGKVVLAGRIRIGVAPGALFTPAKWAGSVDRVDLDARAGMGSLTVDDA